MAVMVCDVEGAKKRYVVWQEAVNKVVALRVKGHVEPPGMDAIYCRSDLLTSEI